MKKRIIVLTCLTSSLLLNVSGCATFSSVSKVTQPSYEGLDVQRTDLGKLPYNLPNPEIQCLGDLQAFYETWDVEGGPQNQKYNLTILPVTNQTVMPSSKIPNDMSMVTQNIAARLGIGYNVIFIPSNSDIAYAPNSLYTSKYSPLLIDRANNSSNNELANFQSNISHKDITIIASLTEFDVSVEDTDSGNVNYSGETNKGKSISAGASIADKNFSGKISMVFNTGYFAKTGDYSTPQIVYNPNTATQVTIEFKDLLNSEEFSFSYDGAKPVIGTKSVFSTNDSRFAAINLLIERGLLKTLGKYHRLPYWRCMYENQVSEKVYDNKTKEYKYTRPLYDQPLTLNQARNMKGYDSDVEDMIRRMYRYQALANGLGTFKKRLERIDNSQEVILVAQLPKNQETPKVTDDVFSIAVPKGTYDRFNLAQCSQTSRVKQLNQSIFELSNSVQQSQASNNLATQRQKTLNQTVQQRDGMVKQCESSYKQRFNAFLNNEGYSSKYGLTLLGKTSGTGQSFYNTLNAVTRATINSPDLMGDKKEYTNFVEQLGNATENGTISMESAFVNLWMSAPFKEKARIYPYYINNDKIREGVR